MGCFHFKREAMKARLSYSVLILLLVLTVVSLIALCLGPINYHPFELGSLFEDPMERGILLDLRLPRVLFALLVGYALSFAGVATQGLFRNPLADPYVLGISGGAAVGGSARERSGCCIAPKALDVHKTPLKT